MRRAVLAEPLLTHAAEIGGMIDRGQPHAQHTGGGGNGHDHDESYQHGRRVQAFACRNERSCRLPVFLSVLFSTGRNSAAGRGAAISTGSCVNREAVPFLGSVYSPV